MHTRFEGSLLLVTGREGESPGNEVAVVTRVGTLSNLRRRRQQQHQKTIGFMSKTKALHVHQDFSTFL